ncbi:MAG TPA: universal stress protein [Ignavibacteriaceae bacterium]|nr:universal stress protein [Ignavibacteriaceae bacterium]
MNAPFKRIGLAITFSPTGKSLLIEAKRLSLLFDAELVLIHVGERNPDTEKKLKELITSVGIDVLKVIIEWENGDPAKAIIRKCAEKEIDLLVAGALEKESIITYYIGSVARKLMREAPCSVLILVNPSSKPTGYKKICVSVDFTPECELTILKAYQLAKSENADELVLIREFQVPGLAITVYDSGSTEETELSRRRWREEEKEKIEILVKELKLTGIKVSTESLYGKEGWVAKNFVKDAGGDLFVVTAPRRKLKFFDRLFQHDIEYVFEQLPCSILIVKPGIN